MIATIGFWASVGVVLYVYLGYPLTLLLMPRRRAGASQPGNPALRVTLITAAYNEVRHIRDTVLNKLQQDYPPELLDVIVVSDGSTDGTDEAVLGIASPRLRLLRQEPRQGKTCALNLAVATACGDVLVFSDANSRYEPQTVRRLVEAFTDPGVGYVTGRLVYEDPGETAVGAGSGMYMRYENWIRRLESRVGSVVGVNGGVDAVRRSLYCPMRADHLPDFVLPLHVVRQGARVVYTESAVSREYALGMQRDEYRMRVRVSLRALHTLAEFRDLMHPRHGASAFQLLVHKALRYLLVLPMVAAFGLAAALLPMPLYGAAFAAQVAFYALAGVGWLSGGRITWRPVFIPFYFCLVHVAAGAALVRFLHGERQIVWTPRKGL